jgi:hypothetical protein
MVSVIVVAVDAAARVRVAPATPVPEVNVVMVCAAPKPLFPLNVKGPTPPFDILVNVTVGKRTFVIAHVSSAPGRMFAAATVTT